MNTTGRLMAISVSDVKGTRKRNVPAAQLVADWGIAGDAHAGRWHRQVSLLAVESIATMVARGLTVGPGDFAENLATEGIDLKNLPIGAQLSVGETVLAITQIGKVCHARCAIYEAAGDCVMPREGVFARVLQGGVIRVGDAVRLGKAVPPAEGADARTRVST